MNVDLKTPDIAIIVEVIKTVVCVGVAKNYFEKKKYNLIELAKIDKQTEDVKAENGNCPHNEEVKDCEDNVVNTIREEEIVKEIEV